ncbi:Diphosphomevalonate decarboxylase [Cylindrobasidium torrendii FP15055 ss-10]|uniref:Diphosphomevalonate decarboxylase n=1 Tax=Cylindrobasidium torrendii FP15055 ss-10 TaxID=1314674 RepID=A0A0D7B1Y7_9AGAR|nr:Diphosphomevalonate decarboxylase [Cylindrobasidium torrendii FP15055 ss-10]
MSVFQATASAPVNIACIKYWGKRDTKLILPTNSSLSVTLDQDHLRSTTTSRADPSFKKDTLWLNGKDDPIKEGGRLATCINELKRLRKVLVEDKDASAPKLSTYAVHIASYNNFPTAAGLASSASGFAALVSSLAKLYELPSTPSELSLIARQGSGSACRSLFGGYVAWEMGTKADGSDSYAVEVAPQSHWPEMHAVICVVNDAKKGTSSTSGMQRTVETSALLQHRIKHVVPKRMADISAAIQARDFDAFAQITMADSNQFHAVALDTEPPIFYMNDVSKAIIALIVEYNRVALEKTGHLKAAYTYDAGPNAVIYTLQENAKEIVELIHKYFPQKEAFNDRFQLFGGEGVKGKVVEGFNEAVAQPHEVDAVKGIIHTKVGDGPRTLGAEESLLNAEGTPKTLA